MINFCELKATQPGAPSELELTQIFEPQQQFPICPFIFRSGSAQKRKCWCYAEWLDRIRSFPEEWDTHTHATGKSAFITADLTQPKTVCVSVCASLCLSVRGRGDTAWHDSHSQKNPDSPAAAWVRPGRCGNSSRKLRECEIKTRNFPQTYVRTVSAAQPLCVKTTSSVTSVWNVCGPRGEACACHTHTGAREKKGHAESDRHLWTMRHLRDLFLHDKRCLMGQFMAAMTGNKTQGVNVLTGDIWVTVWLGLVVCVFEFYWSYWRNKFWLFVLQQTGILLSACKCQSISARQHFSIHGFA